MANLTDPTQKLPPLENWFDQTLAYGFYLDRTLDTEYGGNTSLGQAGRLSLRKPLPEDMHLLNLNPQQLTYDEPLATDIKFTQGGGKYIESKGGVIKSITIRGTTGVLPPLSPHAQHMGKRFLPGNALTDTQVNIRNAGGFGASSGFYEFYRLRRTFRVFMAERREGRVVHMHWMDFKGDEFWNIEPIRFSLDRGRFTYNYTISFNLIEPSERPFILHSTDLVKASKETSVSSPLKSGLPVNTALDNPTRLSLARLSQLSGGASTFVKQFTSGVLAIEMQRILRNVNAIQSFFADLASIRRAILDSPIALYRQLASSIRGLEDAFADNTPAAFKKDVNEWLLEMRFVTEGLISHHQSRFGTTPGQALVQENAKWTQPRASTGTRNNLLSEPANSTGSPTANPFIGTAGFNLIGNVKRMADITSLRAEDVLTGETIFDVAFRIFNDVQRFVDLIIINKLQPPFIVASSNDKPPGTIAWGERILVPASNDKPSRANAAPVDANVVVFSGTVSLVGSLTELIDDDVASGQWRDLQWVGFTVEMLSGAALGEKRVIVSNTDTTLTVNRSWTVAPAPGDTYKVYLELFVARSAPTPETRAFGRDLLGVFTSTNGVTTGTVDTLFGPRGDLMTVEGEENFKQAVTLRFQTPQGANQVNPTYGIPDGIGRPMEPNVLALYLFFVRQGLLADPRVAAVERPKISVVDGVMSFEVAVQPVRVQQTALFRVSL